MAGGLLAAPIATEAQPTGKVWRIGVITYTSTGADMVGPDPKHIFVNALLRKLRALGYVYAKHFVTKPRGADGKAERFADLVEN